MRITLVFSSKSGRLPIITMALLLSLSSCIEILRPHRRFAAYMPAPSPDYALDSCWAALPTRIDLADAVPYNSGLRDAQATATADVFFVHPTTYYRAKSWNADVRNAELNRFTARSTIRKQASVFNAAGRIYAPRYRQATLYSFFEVKTSSGRQALELAYTDVRAAFEYYLTHYNHGRPIILAGHSQGSFHATRLLHEFFENDPKLRRQLVAAYLIGFKINDHEYQTIRPCEDSLQTGCYLTWNSVLWGKNFPFFAGDLAVNPLTWTRDTAAAPASLNRGSLAYHYDRIDVGEIDAKIHDGLLWLHPARPHRYPRYPLPGRRKFRNTFHVSDYWLYYMNIRENAIARLRAWQKLK